MITNQVMKRPMGKFLVEQRTKDSMFNATNLLKQWNEFVEHNDDTQKVGYVKKKTLMISLTTKESRSSLML